MIMFCLTVHHLWGRTLAKHNQDACAVAYAADGYIKARLSVALEVLSDIKQVLKEDAGLALTDKTRIVVKGILPLVALRLRDIHLRLSQWGYWGPPIFNMGPCCRPGEDPNAWKQFGPKLTWPVPEWVGRLGEGF
jgi:hypothetical protein